MHLQQQYSSVTYSHDANDPHSLGQCDYTPAYSADVVRSVVANAVFFFIRIRQITSVFVLPLRYPTVYPSFSAIPLPTPADDSTHLIIFDSLSVSTFPLRIASHGRRQVKLPWLIVVVETLIVAPVAY